MQQLLEFASNHLILTVAWFALAGMLIYSFFSGRLAGYKNIDQHQATMLINREDALLFDIRSVDAFRKGHIAGAKQIPPSQIEKSQGNSLEKNQDRPIIVVCENGLSAGKSCAQLKKQGYTTVYALRGGISAWREAGLPVTRK